MTLQNGLVRGPAAYLWTDTAAFDPETGKLLGHVPKAFYGVTWPWAVVHCGTIWGGDPQRIETMFRAANPMTPADLIAACNAALRAEALAGRSGRLLVAYVCPDQGARMFLLASDELPFVRPFGIFETEEFMSSGNGESWAAEFTRPNMTPSKMRRFIDRQIEAPAETVHGWGGANIGGNIIELKVTGAGVSARVLRAVDTPAEREAA